MCIVSSVPYPIDPMDTTPEQPLKPAQHLILLLLAEESTYGVALMERLDERSGGAIRLNAGSLYRTIAASGTDSWWAHAGERVLENHRN